MNQFAKCPKCRNSNAEQVSFSWWGGVVGPKILKHVKCQSCGAKYNGKSGNYNTTAIVIYVAVVGVLTFALMIFLFAVSGIF